MSANKIIKKKNRECVSDTKPCDENGEGQISRELNILDSVVEDLININNCIFSKLEPVMTDSVLTEDEDNCKEGLLVDIAERIRIQRFRVESVLRINNNINRNLEI